MKRSFFPEFHFDFLWFICKSMHLKVKIKILKGAIEFHTEFDNKSFDFLKSKLFTDTVSNSMTKCVETIRLWAFNFSRLIYPSLRFESLGIFIYLGVIMNWRGLSGNNGSFLECSSTDRHWS